MTGGRKGGEGAGENTYKYNPTKDLKTKRKRPLCRGWRLIVGMYSQCKIDFTNVGRSQNHQMLEYRDRIGNVSFSRSKVSE